MKSILNSLALALLFFPLLSQAREPIPGVYHHAYCGFANGIDPHFTGTSGYYDLILYKNKRNSSTPQMVHVPAPFMESARALDMTCTCISATQEVVNEGTDSRGVTSYRFEIPIASGPAYSCGSHEK